MAQFTVRDFDDGLYKRLKERAEFHHRSLEGEVRDMLARILGPVVSPVERTERARRAEAIRASVKPGDVDLVAAIREDRDNDWS